MSNNEPSQEVLDAVFELARDARQAARTLAGATRQTKDAALAATPPRCATTCRRSWPATPRT